MSDIKNEKNVVVFSDTTGRFLIGDLTDTTEEVYKIASPHIVQPQDRGDGNLAIGFVPYAYLELFDPESEGVWEFPRNSIVITTLKVAEQTEGLYNRIVDLYKSSRLDMKASQEEAGSDDGKVVKLVD